MGDFFNKQEPQQSYSQYGAPGQSISGMPIIGDQPFSGFQQPGSMQQLQNIPGMQQLQQPGSMQQLQQPDSMQPFGQQGNQQGSGFDSDEFLRMLREYVNRMGNQ